uniref:MADS70 n=1 Tax=Hippophae rhamnoides TaxID=193516 RepID=A0AAU7LJL2_9ROSA
MRTGRAIDCNVPRGTSRIRITGNDGRSVRSCLEVHKSSSLKLSHGYITLSLEIKITIRKLKHLGDDTLMDDTLIVKVASNTAGIVINLARLKQKYQKIKIFNKAYKRGMAIEIHWSRDIERKEKGAYNLISYKRGQISDREVGDTIWKTLFQGKLTYLHWNRGEEMAPIIGGQGGTLLVRKLPATDPTRVFIGDVVVLKDPEKPEGYIVRRLAAVEGYEMASTDEKDEPFVLENNECWVLADNPNLKPKEANDSRKFGPVPMTDIAGRVIYCLRTAVDHGPVQNSYFSMRKDSPILDVELDVDEMTKNHKA